MRTGMTVGDLRKAIDGLDDALPVFVDAIAVSPDDEIDNLHAVATGASFAKASSGGFFSGPPVDHLSIDANGVPEGTCDECARCDGKHEGYCGKGADKAEDDGLGDDDSEDGQPETFAPGKYKMEITSVSPPGSPVVNVEMKVLEGPTAVDAKCVYCGNDVLAGEQSPAETVHAHTSCHDDAADAS